MTEWRAIPGYEGLYEVSSSGEVRSARNSTNSRAGVLLKPQRRAKYLGVTLCKDGRRTSHCVHRLVALAFLGDPIGRDVNHKNADRADNRLENLEYCSKSENERHKRAMLAATPGKGTCAKLEANEVALMRKLRDEGWTYKQLSERFGVCLSNAHAVCSRQTWRSM